MIGQAAEHAGDFHSQSMALVKHCFGQILLIPRDVELCSHLATRTFGDVEKLNELGIASPLKAFSDIGEDGNGSAPNLIYQTIITSKLTLSSGRVDQIGQLPRLLPDFQVFKTGGHTSLLCSFPFAL